MINKRKIIFFLIFILVNNCSFDNKTGIWGDSEKEKEQLYNDVYESDKWKTEIFPPIPKLIDRNRTVVTIIEPKKTSVIR